ncbi:MAG TPA: ATP-binding protein [Gammaproteobacteria bacterium]|nr:ATP-binding protein [Gammaproteobacteria bacterium]
MAAKSRRRPGRARRNGAETARPAKTAKPRSPQREYADIFTHNPIPMWIFDLGSLRILAVNAAALRHYGYGEREFLGMTIKDIRSEEDAASLEHYMATARDTLNSAGLWRHRRKDGSTIDVEITSHTLHWRGHQARLVSANDITERLQAEARIRELNATLESQVRERTQQLESVNRELEAFSYSVSHDLRAPLRVIDGFSQALMEDYAGRLEGSGSKYLTRIRATTQRMGVLIDDLLTLARVSRRNVRRGDVDVSALAAEVVKELSEKEPAREVVTGIQSGMRAHADGGLVKIVLDNLIGNAWKFTSRTPAARIEVSTERYDGVIAFCVRDNGAGFDTQYTHKLFGAFQRLHAESEFTGTGIGLATVARVAALHGGRAWAEGETGKGAVFRFTLEEGRPDE